MVVYFLRSISIFICLFLLSGCYRNQVEMIKIKINRDSLASSFTQAPDPRQKAPATGEQLLISLDLDPEIDLSNCRAILCLVYQSLETQEIEFIPKKHKEEISFFILGEQYKQSQGILTYKLEVYVNNKTVALYQHPMWFKKQTTHKSIFLPM